MSDSAGAPPFARAIDLLGSASTVTVLCHVQPDADTIGSGLALALVLWRRGADVQVAFAAPERVPESMEQFPGRQFIVAPADVRKDAELVVTVDCGSRGRLGALSSRLDGAQNVLVIDHHLSNTRFGTVNLIDPQAESTTAVIVTLLDLWGVPLDQDLAHCLFAGLVTDTGSFRWVRPGSHLLAERLLATGIDGAGIARRLLDTHPFGWLPMLGSVLGSAKLVPQAGRGAGLVYAVITSADSQGLRSEEIESVVDIVRTTAEAGVAAVFKQAEGGWTVSLRSKDRIDVSLVATSLGGGGHRYSAGYTAHGGIDDAVKDLVSALDGALATP